MTGEAIRALPVAGIAHHVAAVVLAKRPMFGPRGFAGRGATDEALQWVANIYRRAYLFGDPPTKAVAETLGLSPATAGRWVRLARAAKHLGPAETGKAGG